MASFTINFHLSHPQPKINNTGFCALAGLLLKPKAPVSQLVNAEVNSGNRKAVLASNYATRMQECIMYKQLNN